MIGINCSIILFMVDNKPLKLYRKGIFKPEKLCSPPKKIENVGMRSALFKDTKICSCNVNEKISHLLES